LDQLKLTTESSIMQMEGRKLLTRRKQLFENPACRTLYESRKETIGRISQERREIENMMEKEQALAARSNLLRLRLDEILESLGTKTHQYTGQAIELEKPIEIAQKRGP